MVRFCEETVDAHGLRAMLMLGEAGIGKSRVLDEAKRRVSDSLMVVHIRFEPGAGVASLLESAVLGGLSRSGGRSAAPDAAGFAATIGALQKLARLRPTVLVLEDTHLLAGESIAECAALFQALNDETISVLFAARTIDLTPRSILERYLVEELVVNGLGRADLEALWGSMFLEPGSHEAITLLASATHGNPLAIRAGLLAALESGSIHECRNGWCVTNLDAFEMDLDAGVETMAGAMAAHATADDVRAARAIAPLGEVFAREAAEHMLPDASQAVDGLVARGILSVTQTAPAPVVGTERTMFPASNFPLLAFSHSLLHRHFLRHSKPDPNLLAHAIAGNAPLYSVIPFQLFGVHGAGAAISGSVARDGALRSAGAAFILDEGPDWPLAPDMLRAADVFAGLAEAGLSADDRFAVRTVLLSCRLSLLRRDEYGEEYARLVGEFLALTDRPTNEREAAQRIVALLFQHRLCSRVMTERCYDVWKDVHDVIDGFPALCAGRNYVLYLREMAQFARRLEDRALSGEIEKRLNEALDSPAMPDSLRKLALQTISPSFLMLFSTPEELKKRIELYFMLETVPDETTGAAMPKTHFLLTVGMYHEALKLTERCLPQMNRLGLVRSELYASLARLACEAAIDADLEDVRIRTRALIEGAPEALITGLRENAGYVFTFAGLLRGQRAWAREVVEEYHETRVQLEAELLTALLIDDGPAAALAQALEAGGSPEFIAFARSVAADDGFVIGAELPPEAVRVLSRTILRVEDLIAVIATLDVIRACGGERMPGAHTAAALEAMITWFVERRLVECARAALERYERLAPADRRAALRETIERADAPSSRRSGGRLAVHLLGTIEVQGQGGRLARLRGVRLRTLLGLMAADQMLERPLEHREFCQLAAGNQDSLEQARKIVNISVYRLREIMGADAILTDAETPRLNLGRLDVDLLLASDLLSEAADALARGSLMRAHMTLARTFAIINGRSAFPGLDEPFFEAARKDFEARLLAATMDVARGMLYAGNPETAAAVVRSALTLLPNDPELLDLQRCIVDQMSMSE